MTRTLLTFAAAVLILGLFPLVADAQSDRDSVHLQDGSQAMTADIYFGPIRIDVSSGPNGENPTGQVAFFVSGLQLRVGSPSCLAVRGNTATITFQDEGFLGSPDTVTVQVTDGQPDQFDAALNARALGDCTPLPPTGEQGPLVVGDLEIVDSREADSCKRGGWRTFGSYRNQGQCVSDFSRKSRP